MVFGSIGLFCLGVLNLMVVGAALVPDVVATVGGVFGTAAATLAAAAGLVWCASALRVRRTPPPRRRSFVGMLPGGGRHTQGA